ncbi:MAG: DUF6134 family protein [Alphaproteobacteria bacterium]|nr:DUF6134 family protein [Alphaproteobacteria bacterium]
MNPFRRTTFRALAWAALPILVTWGGGAVRAADDGQNRVLSYKAVHAKYGDIGTYINTIAVKDGVTTVTTQVRLQVRILGITAHREAGDRTEQWKDGRIVAFQSITTANGDRTEVRGEAKGDVFAVTTSSGTVDAPANIRLSNPWSDNFIGATTMLSVDSGKIQPVNVSTGEKATVKIGGATVETLRYDITCKPPYKVWLDGNRVPVMFNVDDESGIVTFTVVK